ncbi:MAG: HEPN domain-containing protein [Gemmataceae bacterium]|nr:HEPN domain-containing protein [Gemmataceae bacterium]
MLADIRIAEAKALLDQGMFAGAYYLAGYSVEFALKACIAKLTNQYDFPEKRFVLDCYTHDVEKLLALAGIDKQFESDAKASPTFFQFWQVVKEWDESCRFEIKVQNEAQSLYDAIADPTKGVLLWI